MHTLEGTRAHSCNTRFQLINAGNENFRQSRAFKACLFPELQQLQLVAGELWRETQIDGAGSTVDGGPKRNQKKLSSAMWAVPHQGGPALPPGRGHGGSDVVFFDRDQEELCARPRSADTVQDMELDPPSTIRALSEVPEDCFVHILKHLSAAELLRVGMVNKEIFHLGNSDLHWHKLCMIDYGADSDTLLECYRDAVPSGPSFWKRMYRELRDYGIEIEFIAGPRAGDLQKVLRDKVCMIGRSRTNDVCILHDEMVSRKHAQIRVKEDGHFYLQDIGGINRTFVNRAVIPQMIDR